MIDANGTNVNALTHGPLTMQAFHQLSGLIDGISYIKIVVDTKTKVVHFMDDHLYKFHAKYIARDILQISEKDLLDHIDELNNKFYFGKSRDLYLGILALIKTSDGQFFTLETVEVDTMDRDMILDFYQTIKNHIPQDIPLLFKPANHSQELSIKDTSKQTLPRIYTHELTQSRSYIPLNIGEGKGRLRYFKNKEEYKNKKESITWYDIIVMDRVPDNIPRISGIINTSYTTPLSHTNILATGWQIPNAIQIGAEQIIKDKNLNGKWVTYVVAHDQDAVILEEIQPMEVTTPLWKTHQVSMEKPHIDNDPILSLYHLRKDHQSRHGTKAANLGEVNYLLQNKSERLLGFYQIPRSPRPHLLMYAQKLLGSKDHDSLIHDANQFLRKNLTVPKGISIPFSYQRRFLESSPIIQQTIGKLKMALELNDKSIDSLCIKLQQMIQNTNLPEEMKSDITQKISMHLRGADKFVVRSSSNAEDLQNFSAAGIYESYNHITSLENLFDSIKKVWASLVSPRSVHLRKDVGISLDDAYMGVIIQEEVSSEIGGVLVTVNPLNSKDDFRNVYINASHNSSIEVVQGTGNPYQLLYNIVEGGGRTILKDPQDKELTESQLDLMGTLAFSGKLLQSHFAPDDLYNLPVDIEWAINKNKIYLLQIRPYQFE